MRAKEFIIESVDFAQMQPQQIAAVAQDAFAKLYPGVKLYGKSVVEGVGLTTHKGGEGSASAFAGSDTQREAFYLTVNAYAEGNSMIVVVEDATAGKYKGGATAIIKSLFEAGERLYQTEQRELVINDNANYEAWSTIANRVGAEMMESQEFINEISDERLQRYLDRAGRQVDARQERMARVRDRLNKGYEIYHAETPSKIVHRFDARTPAEAQRYYADYIANYESDVDYDLRLRRATGIIDEAFDQPYPLVWEKSEYGAYDAYTKLDDGSNLSISFELESAGPTGEDEEWHVSFWRNYSLEVTGEGDAQRIFATVLSAIQKFIKKENPERIVFSAAKGEGEYRPGESRARLYSRMVQRYAQALGYQTSSQEDEDVIKFELTRQAVFENFADGKVKGKSRPGRVKRAGASCQGSVTDLRAKAKKYGGEKGKMYHWCANMKAGKKKAK